ncbi:hypothetical protein AAA799P11_00538 [Marine Group I thaumarchaeote SCGC AAA799-P11]|uniref:Uncharacterized protein n=1 Tax=Marine Group I thaumarchaeote SCGC AAA799-P11 TaxID=1502295 RepID=A0A087S1E5_9ARCH|nr:hypothetical protein AAA799P11_00538 [Marine Group I thaumarchaeote SCGC AAA799-P11]
MELVNKIIPFGIGIAVIVIVVFSMSMDYSTEPLHL